MPNVVDDVRGFNRFYTRVLGLLRPDLAGSAFGLTEARVLFELAHRDDVAVSDLRRDLDLDAGYLSRILSGFTASGLVAREKSAADGRRQVVRLTDEGRRAFDELDRLQADAIDTLLAPLDDVQRTQLVGAMGQIRRMLSSEARLGQASFFVRPSPAISGGSSSGMAPDMRPNTAGMRRSRRSSRASSPTSPSAVTPDARRRGSPSWTANGSAACSARPPTTRMRSTPHSCACCSSSRRRAERVSAPGWLTSACDSPGDPAIDESPCGPTTYWSPPAESTSGPGFGCDRREPHHSFGHDLVGEYWSRDL